MCCLVLSNSFSKWGQIFCLKLNQERKEGTTRHEFVWGGNIGLI